MRPPNDLRISCKRHARPALSYVSLTPTGRLPEPFAGPEALAGCMRLLDSDLRRSLRVPLVVAIRHRQSDVRCYGLASAAK